MTINSRGLQSYTCIKTNSAYLSYDTDSSLEYCYYHAWLVDNTKPTKNLLREWIDDGKICKNSIEHCKRIIGFLDV